MSALPTVPARHGITPWQFGLLLALLVLAAFPQVILGIETFGARDYGFFAYPLAHFQRDCFWHGELPFWDPYNNCGMPFLAQWNTMPLYPPALIYLLFPLGWSLSFFNLLHLWFAGMGMFFLARRWTGNPFAAAFAGSVFAFNGFTLNLLMWPSHIATFSWMPWVVLAAEAAWREGGRKLPLAAFAGAMQMLAGGPETIFLTWLIVSALWLQQLIMGGQRRAALWRLPSVVVLVVLLSLVQLLPFFDLVAHSQRETGYTDLRWSMPASGLANFLVPMAFGSTATEGIFLQHGQSWTSSYYLGGGTLWLALLAVFCIRQRRVWFCGAIAVVALLCALGGNTPVYPLIRKLVPQLSFVTYPVKYVMAVAFVAPLLAAHALAALGAPVSSRTRPEPGENAGPDPRRSDGTRMRKWLLPLGLILAALIGIVLVWMQRAGPAGDDTHAAFIGGLARLGFLAVTGLVLFGLTRKEKTSSSLILFLTLILVAWLDVLTHEPTQNPTMTPGVYQENLARQRLAMHPQPELGGSRAMLSPTAMLDLIRFGVSDARQDLLAKRIGYCADINLLDAVPKVDGFFSLTPREFDRLLTFIYNVTNGNWSGLENFMGVSQYTSPTNDMVWRPRTGFLPLVTAGQQPVFLDETNTLWEMARNHFDGASMVFLPPADRPAVTVSNATSARISDVKFTNNAVDFQVEAAAPALAVVAQTYYHDWRAEIDGRPGPLLRANVAFEAVQVPAGKHHVHLFYQDRAFEIGAAISVCMWVNCFVGYLALRRRDAAIQHSRSTPNAQGSLRAVPSTLNVER